MRAQTWFPIGLAGILLMDSEADRKVQNAARAMKRVSRPHILRHLDISASLGNSCFLSLLVSLCNMTCIQFAQRNRLY